VRRPVSPPSAADVAEVTIERVGADGDGIATLPDGERIYLPLTLPGEVVQVGATTRRVMTGPDGPAIRQSSPDRVTPPCPHFGACGGCTLQHWQDHAYAAWKSDLLRDALRRAGYTDPPIAPLVRCAPMQRRRMDFAARRTPHGVALGLHTRSVPSPAHVVPSAAAPGRAAQQSGGRARAPHGARPVIDLSACPVLHPTLFALIEPLRRILPRLSALGREASVVANLLDHGSDLLLRTDRTLDRSDREHLIRFAREQRLVRVSSALGKAEPEPVIVLQPPIITLSGVPVELPPGAFLQATNAGEAAIVDTVLAGLPQPLPARARIGELYAGCGTLTFALAQRARVLAWEGDAAAASALRQGANRAGLGGRVAVTQRDLARQPVMAADLNGFAAAVLDPPHAGAAAQTAQIAAAKVPTVVYVSCNPAMLARDARTLRDTGYALAAATPVDQFLWSARLESVCVFGHASG